jgi:hypothetical protein
MLPIYIELFTPRGSNYPHIGILHQMKDSRHTTYNGFKSKIKIKIGGSNHAQPWGKPQKPKG